MTSTDELIGLLIIQLVLGAVAASIVGALGSARNAKSRNILEVWVLVFLFVGFLPISLFCLYAKHLFNFAKACWWNE